MTASLEYAFVIAIANPFGPLLGVLFADKLERKTQILRRADYDGRGALPCSPRLPRRGC